MKLSKRIVGAIDKRFQDGIKALSGIKTRRVTVGAISSNKLTVQRANEATPGSIAKPVLLVYGLSYPVVAQDAVEIDIEGMGSFVAGKMGDLPTSFPYVGDGSDGAVTIGSNTTLTRDMFYSSLTVSAGFTLSTAGYRIFCSGVVSVSGTIQNNGSNGSGDSGGSGGPAGYFQGGASGGNGNTAGGSVSAPSGGGNGGAGSGGGGVGGTVTAGSSFWKHEPTMAVLGGTFSGTLTATFSTIGGGAGGGGGAGATGGGGGGGGGVVAIYAPVIIVNSGGIIRALGGNGVTNVTTGGGGGGGCILLVTRSYTNNGTVSVAGGTGNVAGSTGNIVTVGI